MSQQDSPVTELLRELQELIEGAENVMQGSHPTKYEEGFIASTTIIRSKVQGFAKQIEDYIEAEVDSRLPDAIEASLESRRENQRED